MAVIVVLGGAYYGLVVMNKPATPLVAVVPSVATVNGVDITKADYDSELASAVTSYKAQGIDVTDAQKLSQIQTQVLDGLVNNEILSQEANKLGIKATQADVDAQYQNILTQAGDADKLKSQLAAAGITDAQLRNKVSRQLAIRAYVLQKIDINSATTSPAEIKKFYDDNVKGQKGAPALKDVSSQITQQLVANKQQQLLNALISSLRTGAKVDLHLPKVTTTTPGTK